MGETSLDYAAFRAYLDELGRDKYAGPRYHLLDHNCNHFSNEVCLHLTNMPIPQSILDLPNRVKTSPVASLLMPLIESQTPRGEGMSSLHREPSADFKHFPHTDYIIFDQKIDEEKFNDKVEGILKGNEVKTGDLSDDIRDCLKKLITRNSCLSDGEWKVIKVPLSMWPKEDLFPIFDAIRFSSSQNALRLNDEELDEFFVILQSYVKTGYRTNVQLSLKILCNLFAFAKTRTKLLTLRELLIADINALLEVEENSLPKILQICLSSLAFNYAIVYLANPDEEASFQIVSAIISNYLVSLETPEALYRTVVALGTLIIKNPDVKELALALEAKRALAKVKSGDTVKLKEAVEECRRVLS